LLEAVDDRVAPVREIGLIALVAVLERQKLVLLVVLGEEIRLC
jgi:hypothetical protein